MATWKNKEKESLETLLLGEKDLSRTDSILRKCSDTTSNHLEIYKNKILNAKIKYKESHSKTI